MARPSHEQAAREVPRAAAQSGVEPGASSRRLTLDFNELGLEGEYPGPLSKEGFLTLCESHPGKLFDGLYEHYSKLESQLEEALRYQQGAGTEEVEALEEEVANLKEQLKDHRHAMTELIAERDTALAQITIAPGGKKSTKIPDGQLLSDGKDPKFESWLIDVENKLEANADHYPTALARMAYVKSMCKGDAANHLLPRFRKDSLQRYLDVEDIFDHLKTLYMDENRVVNAKMELRRLVMRDMKFQAFLSKFTLLAQESGLSAAEWKEELYYKLSFKMQHAMLKESTDNAISYEAFVQGCHTTANRLEQIAEGEKRARPRTNGNSSGERSGAKLKPKNDTPRNNLSFVERKKLMDEDKCFNCKLPGHRAYQCTLKPTPDLKAVEQTKDAYEDSENDNA